MIKILFLCDFLCENIKIMYFLKEKNALKYKNALIFYKNIHR